MIAAKQQRRWLLPALACAAMLLLPALAFWLVPRPHGFALPPAPSAPAAAQAPRPASPSAAPRRAPPPGQPVQPAQAVASTVPAEAGPVAGVVLDPDGHPASNATVSCEDGAEKATTDEQGRFQLGPDAAGCLAIARHPDLFASDKVALGAGRANVLRLNRGGGIEGDVVDEHGTPLASFLLAVESYQGTGGNAPMGQLKTVDDPHGAFAWDNLVPGRYVLTASADGRPPARSRPVDVDAGRTTAHVRITLPRGALLRGRVLDAVTHHPLVGAMVTLDAFTATRAQAILPGRSDDQGAYTLEGAPAGPFSIRVSRDGYRGRIVTGLTTRGAPTLQQDVELTPIVDGGPTGDDFAGIGAFIAPSPNGVTFSGLRPDGPAEQAGIHTGDIVRRIDGADVESLSVNEVMQSLRGPDGSRVTVQVERDGQRIDVTIQRRAIVL